jgi:hypothetical protein
VQRRLQPHSAEVAGVAVSRDGRFIFGAGYDASISCVDRVTGAVSEPAIAVLCCRAKRA